MIIRSIRLLNIKSYGEGPDGNGVTITFEPGINRIAGKNGHGKSTLIESIGYALFLSSPVHEEEFKIATYLLRAGKKAGEIDVVFDFAGQTYRLERGLGSQNKRRSKVVLVADGSTEAEGDEQVEKYLCRLFGFTDLVRLSELFSKLVGVKQGRLAWPFDSTAKNAREHFEPLLDVEIFRKCFYDLLEVVKHFEALNTEHRDELARLDERIQNLSDSAAKLPTARQLAEDLKKKVDLGTRQKLDAEKVQAAHEQKARVSREAKALWDAALNHLGLATQRKGHEQRLAQESIESAGVVKETQAAYHAYNQAEQLLRNLQAQQAKKSNLEKQRATADNLKTESKGALNAARQQAELFTKQKQSRSETASTLRTAITTGESALVTTQPEFDRQAAASQQARQSRDALNHWLAGALAAVAKNQALLAEIIIGWKQVSAWNPKALANAQGDENKADEAAKALAQKLAAAEQASLTLSEQLTQIGGGTCPFLKEKCRQFDPKKVASDITAQQKEAQRLKDEHTRAVTTHQLAKTRLQELLATQATLGQLRKELDRHVAHFVQTHNELFPLIARQHFQVLGNYLSAHAAAFQVLPLADAVLESCYQESGTLLVVSRLEEQAAAATALLTQANRALTDNAATIETRLAAFDQQRDARTAQQQDIKNKRDELQKTEVDIVDLDTRIETQSKAATKAEQDMIVAENTIKDLDQQLQAYTNLEVELRTQQTSKDANTASHQKHLGAKPAAEKLTERQAAFTNSIAAEAQAKELAHQKQEASERATKEFDPAALAAAQLAAKQAGEQLATEAARLENATQELAREQARFAQWEQAGQARAAALVKQGQILACVALTEKARQVLKQTAPLVAQHVCRRIAAHAQQLFNQINSDPVELEWNAERYSLRISPGERRFAMLSGGEQTKLALAMTLAMIQEFNGLKFCVFDEPTYGVDADSRQKLAEAVLQLQDAGESRLDQLLLVSHDDAFDGKIEHVVLIQKTAAEGSRPTVPR